MAALRPQALHGGCHLRGAQGSVLERQSPIVNVPLMASRPLGGVCGAGGQRRAFGLITHNRHSQTLGRLQARAVNEKQRTTEQSSSGRNLEEPNPGAGLKAVWYAAENFGKLIGLTKDKQNEVIAPLAGELSRDEVIVSIREDYDEKYFISGRGEMKAYDANCVFADPFVSFRGVKRFKNNVSNLGGMMRDVKLDVYDFQDVGHEVHTKWRFSCILDLPWKPRLAAAGGTTHVLDPESWAIVKHIEQWDIEPIKVVQQLLKPSNKVPTNQWETFMLATSDSDFKGMWYATSSQTWKICLPLVTIMATCEFITQEGLQGVGLCMLEGAACLGLVAGLCTEVIKFSQGMQGGETGTGGRF